VGGAEERHADPPRGRLPAPGGAVGRQAAGGAVRGAASVHQPLQTLVQAQGDDPRGRQAQAATPPTAHAAAAAAGARQVEGCPGQDAGGSAEQQRSGGPAGNGSSLPGVPASLSAGRDQQEQRPRTGAVDSEQARKEQRTLSRFLLLVGWSRISCCILCQHNATQTGGEDRWGRARSRSADRRL
jgi:hypothetical protein